MVTKRCAWGVCKSDSRYRDRDHMKGVWFVPFPKPKSQHDKCLRWVKACGRPYEQLNVEKIKEHHFVCSKHFIGENGPSADNPDPIQSEPTDAKKARYAQKRRSDSPSTTDVSSHPPKMSRECAAEALLALKVGSGAGQVPGVNNNHQCMKETENDSVSNNSFVGSFEICLPPILTSRDKRLVMASHRKTAVIDVKAV